MDGGRIEGIAQLYVTFRIDPKVDIYSQDVTIHIL